MSTSLRAQIESIQEIKQYIRLTISEVETLQEDVRSGMQCFRGQGLTEEFADEFEGPLYMGDIHSRLKDLTEKMMKYDYAFLDEIKRKLEEAY